MSKALRLRPIGAVKGSHDSVLLGHAQQKLTNKNYCALILPGKLENFK